MCCPISYHYSAIPPFQELLTAPLMVQIATFVKKYKGICKILYEAEKKMNNFLAEH
jgi:hypothetical protein